MRRKDGGQGFNKLVTFLHFTPCCRKMTTERVLPGKAWWSSDKGNNRGIMSTKKSIIALRRIQAVFFSFLNLKTIGDSPNKSRLMLAFFFPFPFLLSARNSSLKSVDEAV